MRTQSMDTSIDIERILIQGHQRFSLAQRFARVRSLTASIAEMNRRGTRLDDETSISAYLQHLYGTTFVETLPPLPDMRSARIFDILIPLTTMADLVTDLPLMLALTGGIACCLYGFPRTVRDIDLLVDATTPSFPILLERLATHFLPALPIDGVWSFLDPKTLIKIDMMTKLDGLSIRESLFRASPVLLTENGVTFPILSAEDVVLTRLAWYRETGSKIGRASCRERV